MEDQKGPGPKKKILIRKSTITREPYIAEDLKEEKTPMEMKFGDVRMDKTSAKEIEELKKSSGLRDVYTMESKTLVPKTESEQYESKKSFEEMSPEDATYFLTENEFKGSDIPNKKALRLINRLAEIADKKGFTSPGQIEANKEFLINESGKENPEYKVDANIWDILNKQGKNLNKVIHRVNRSKKETAKAPKYRLGSVRVDEPIGEMKKESPESKVVEDGIDKAVRLVKDEKTGVVRQEMKDIK